MSRPVLTDSLNQKVRDLERREYRVVTITDANIGPQAIVTDNIADGAITADLISSVNADSIDGVITAEMIGTINATQITGSITSSQIGSVNAGAITGTITSSQIGSVSAGTITGTITSGQIGSVAATTITGTISSGQIGSVSATTITGSISAGQIGSVNASTISGGITASQITSVTASTISGGIAASQITSVNATAISGSILASQIDTVNAGDITGGISASQITSVNATAITGSITAAQIGSVSAGAISSVNASAITGGIQAGQIANVAVNTITVGNMGSGANMLSNSSFEDPVTPLLGWGLYNNGLSPAPVLSVISSATSKHGGKIAQLANGTDTTGDMGVVSLTDSGPIVEVGKTYTLSAWFWSSTAVSARVHINWLDASNAVIGGGNAGNITTFAAQWTRGAVTAVAPANAVEAKVYAMYINPASGVTRFVDAIQFEESDIATAYNPRSDEILSNAVSATMIGSVSATSIQGSILAAQIGSVNATAITGSITSTQIGSVAAGTITGTIGASQIGSVNASAITGSISAAQIGSVNASAIAGSITAAQIASVNAGVIAGTLTSGQIASVSAGTITGSITSTQIGSVAAGTITVGQLGGGGNLLYQTAPTAADVTAASRWTAQNGTLAVETTEQYLGFNTWKFTSAAAGLTYMFNNYTGNHTLPAVAGEEFTFTAWVKSMTASRAPRATIIWYDAANAQVGTTQSGAAPTAVVGEWEKRTVTATAPASTAKVRVLVYQNASTGASAAGEIMYVAAMQLEKASIGSSYGPRPDEVLAGSITAGKITVATLSAISANMGTLTAGVIEGGTVRTAASPAARVEFTSAGIRAYTDATNITFAVDGATGKVTTLAGIGGPNLLPNSGFENSSTNFDGHYGITGGTLDTTIAKYGANSAKVTIAATGSTYITVSSAPKGTSPTEPGKEHVASVWAYTTLSGKGVSVSTRYFDSTNTFLANGTGNTVTLVPNEWTRVVSGIGVAPANTTQVGIRVEVGVTGGKTTGDVYYLDAMQVEEGRIATAYGPKPDEIRPNQVTGVEIAPGSVEGSGGSGHIDVGSIRGGTGQDIAADSIAAVSLATDSVTAVKVAANAITANKLDVLPRTSLLSAAYRWDGSTKDNFSFSTGTAANLTVTSVADSQFGGQVARVTGGSTRFAFPDIIAYDPQALYRFTVRVRRQTAATDPLKERLYIGFDGYAADGTTWVSVNGSNSLSGQHYAISNYDMNAHAVGTWVELSGYYKGFAAVTGTTGSLDPANPNKAHPNVRYFRPMAICNYNGGDGVFDIDAITVDEVTVEPGQITTTELKADAVDATIISANAITSKHTITGAVLQTATSGKRVVINSSGLKAYATDGVTPLLNYDIPSGTLSITGTINVGSTIPASTLTGTIGGGNQVHNSSFEDPVNPLVGWTVYNSGLSPVGTLDYVQNTANAKHISSATGTGTVARWTNGTDTVGEGGVVMSDFAKMPRVEVGKSYTASAWVKTFTGGAENFKVIVNWYTAADALISGVTTTLTAASTTVWTRTSGTFIPPATAYKARVYVAIVNPASGGVYWIDAVQFEEGEVATAYQPKADEILSNTVGATQIGAQIGGGNLLYQTAPTSADVTALLRWSGSNPHPPVLETTQKFANYNTFKHTADGAGIAVIYNDYTSDNIVPAVPGETFTASGYWYTGVASRGQRLRIIFYDAANAAVAGGTFTSPTVALTQNVWTRLSISATAPANTAKVRVLYDFGTAAMANPTAGDIWYLGGPQLERGDVPTAFAPRVDEYPAGSVGDAQITTGVTGSKISGALTNATIGGGSVTGAGTLDGTIITDDSITTNKIGANQITANKLNVIQGGGNMMDDSSFESTLAVGYWTSSTGVASITQVTVPTIPSVVHGTSALQFTNSSTAIALSRIRTQDANSPKARPGVKYTLSAYMRSTTAGRRARICAIFRTAANATIGSQQNGAYADLVGDGSWVRLPPLTVSDATSTVDHVQILVEWNVTAGGNFPAIETYQMDAVQFEEGDLMTAYSVKSVELLPGTISGNMIQADAIDGKTITGAIIQTGAGNNTEVRLDSTGLKAYDATSTNTVFIDSATGSLTATKGTITGAMIQTALPGTSRVELSTAGLRHVTAANATGNFELTTAGVLNVGGSSTITGGTVQTNTTGPRVRLNSTGFQAFESTSVQSLDISASTGALSINGGVVASVASTLVSFPNPSFTTNTTGWTVGNSATITRDTTIHAGDGASGRMNNIANNGYIETTLTGTFKSGIPYVFEWAQRSTTGGTTVQIGVIGTTNSVTRSSGGFIGTFGNHKMLWIPNADTSAAKVRFTTFAIGDTQYFDNFEVSDMAIPTQRQLRFLSSVPSGTEAANLSAASVDGGGTLINLKGLIQSDTDYGLVQIGIEGSAANVKNRLEFAWDQNQVDAYGQNEIRAILNTGTIYQRAVILGSGGGDTLISDFEFKKRNSFQSIAVTALPASPLHGEEAIVYPDFGSGSNDGVMWHFKYNANSSSAYKWEFIGGNPLFIDVATAETRAASTYGDLATAGPTLTTPLTGDYYVEGGAEVDMGTAAATYQGWASIKRGLSATSDNDAVVHWMKSFNPSGGTGAVPGHGARAFRMNGLFINETVKMQYRGDTANTITWSRRWLKVTPIRVQRN